MGIMKSNHGNLRCLIESNHGNLREPPPNAPPPEIAGLIRGFLRENDGLSKPLKKAG